MVFWEFLLQKEGDRSWLPLESSKVEILEGRYRVVARSSRTNTPMEIRVIHDATAEIPPTRRTQRRQSRTNQDGLIVIMPFTQLLPGIWQLRCFSDLMSDMMGDSWNHTVSLHVLPLESDISDEGDEWDPDWQLHDTTSEGSGAEQIEAEGTGERVTASSASNSTPESIAATTSPSTSPKSLTPTSEQTSDQTPNVTASGIASELLPLAPRSVKAASSPTNIPPADSPAAAKAPTADTPSDPVPKNPSILQQAKQHSQQIVDSIFQELDALSEATPSGAKPADRPNLFPSSATNPSLRIRLGQDTYVVKRGQALTLMGQVESLDQLLTYDLLPVETLQVRLYDPQTSQVLADQRQPLSARRLPFPFTCRITLPEHYQTYLVLGELTLYGPAEGNETPPVLATQSFNVTTDLHELIEAIANDYAQTDLPTPPEASSTKPLEANLPTQVVFINPSKTIAPAYQFRPSPQQPLPPQLHPSDPAKPRKSPELPSLASSSSPADAPTEREAYPAQTDAMPLAESDASSDVWLDLDSNPAEHIPPSEGLTTIQADLSGAVEPGDQPADERVSQFTDRSFTDRSFIDRSFTDRSLNEILSDVESGDFVDRPGSPDQEEPSLASPSSLTFDDADPIPDWDRNDYAPSWRQQHLKHKPIDSPEDVAFRSLNIQERFWDRLQALMADKELSAWLSDAMASEADYGESSDLSPSDRELATVFSRPKRRSIGSDSELAAQEVVVEDELPAPNSTPAQNDEQAVSALTSGATVIQPAMALVLPIGEPVPAPVLEVKDGELVAGDPLTITVKLPDVRPRIYVKLWLLDRQSRSVLISPNWLMNFSPDGFGNLAAQTKLTVPHGSVEMQIEAIAVEMATQRESDKVTLTRKIVPPDLPTLPLDDLDL